MISQIRKRDGRVVPFERNRLSDAVYRCLSSGCDYSHDVADRVATTISGRVENILTYIGGIPTVEDVQEQVERELAAEKLVEEVICYRKYREQHAALRSARSITPEQEEYINRTKKHFRHPAQIFNFLTKYARWREEDQRRETLEETAHRVITFFQGQVAKRYPSTEPTQTGEVFDHNPIPPDHPIWDVLEKSILTQSAMPAMRSMQMAGPAAERCSVAIFNCSFGPIDDLRSFAETLYVLMQGSGAGYSVESIHVDKLPRIKRQIGIVHNYVIQDSTEGWCDALLFLLTSLFNGEDVIFDYSLIRPKGSKLKTKGGRSSGPDPLRELIDFTRALILTRQGKILTSGDALRILCMTGKIVQVGGVRRASEIALTDLEDEEIRRIKSGNFWSRGEGYLSEVNISACYREKPTSQSFLREWIAIAESGTGERGIFNQGSLGLQIPARRLKLLTKFFRKSIESILRMCGTNPCVTGDTWVQTESGPQLVKDLVGKPFRAIVDGKSYSAGNGFWETGVKPVFCVVTDSGYEFRATENHKVLVETKRTRSRGNHRHVREWREVKDLRAGDRVALNDHRDPEITHWIGEYEGSEKETGIQKDHGWLVGFLLGDGNITKNGKANLDFFGGKLDLYPDALSVIRRTIPARSDIAGHTRQDGSVRIGSTGLGVMAAKLGMGNQCKRVTDQIEKSSSFFYEGFLCGWFDADGSVQGDQTKGVSVRLTCSDLESLKRAQRMLSRLGIISTIYQERHSKGTRLMPDGKGGHAPYVCQASHELIIASENLTQFEKRVGFKHPAKSEKLTELLSGYKRALNKEWFTATVKSVSPDGSEMVYDCRVDDVHRFDGNGAVLHNCGEIILIWRQFCNLSIAVARPGDTVADLFRKVELATTFGTLQSLCTDFEYLRPEWKRNCDLERLLGVDIMGDLECEHLRPWTSAERSEDPDGAAQWDKKRFKLLSDLKEHAVAVNQQWSELLGIYPSTAVTTRKPGGNSQWTLLASSLGLRDGKHQIRRFRCSADDPVSKLLVAEGVPYKPENGDDPRNPRVLVFSFPFEHPKGTLVKGDLNAIDQLENWLIWKKAWCEHNPSMTVTVEPDEWFRVGNWVYENWDSVGGLSFFPADNGVYQQPPNEAISKEEYDRLASEFPDINWAKLILFEDTDDYVNVSKELACTAAGCEI